MNDRHGVMEKGRDECINWVIGRNGRGEKERECSATFNRSLSRLRQIVAPSLSLSLFPREETSSGSYRERGNERRGRDEGRGRREPHQLIHSVPSLPL